MPRNDKNNRVCCFLEDTPIFYSNALKLAALCFTSSVLFSQLYSYSADSMPLNRCLFSSSITAFKGNFPVPQCTSCACLSPKAFKSLKCKCVTLPCNCFKQATGSSPERIQCPTSAAAPILALLPSK